MNLQNILKQIRRADQEFGLIGKGDKVAVALSGGKDSMLLFLALSLYQKFAHTDFELVGIHIDVGFEDFDHEAMVDFARKHNLELHIVKTRIFSMLQQEKNLSNTGQIQCSLCSTLKKGSLFKTAKELGCTSVALGHHGDDAVETLLLNMIHGGKASTFLPKQYMSRMDMYSIRPLVYLSEQEIIDACKANDIPAVRRVCPNDGFTQRQEMKELLNTLYERYPSAHENFFKALINEEQSQLWFSDVRTAPALRHQKSLQAAPDEKEDTQSCCGARQARRKRRLEQESAGKKNHSDD